MIEVVIDYLLIDQVIDKQSKSLLDQLKKFIDQMMEQWFIDQVIDKVQQEILG